MIDTKGSSTITKHEVKMNAEKKMNEEKREACTRRNMLTRTALFALGGVVGGATSVAAKGRSDEKKAPPLPWN